MEPNPALALAAEGTEAAAAAAPVPDAPEPEPVGLGLAVASGLAAMLGLAADPASGGRVPAPGAFGPSLPGEAAAGSGTRVALRSRMGPAVTAAPATGPAGPPGRALGPAVLTGSDFDGSVFGASVFGASVFGASVLDESVFMESILGASAPMAVGFAASGLVPADGPTGAAPGFGGVPACDGVTGFVAETGTASGFKSVFGSALGSTFGSDLASGLALPAAGPVFASSEEATFGAGEDGPPFTGDASGFPPAGPEPGLSASLGAGVTGRSSTLGVMAAPASARPVPLPPRRRFRRWRPDAFGGPPLIGQAHRATRSRAGTPRRNGPGCPPLPGPARHPRTGSND